MVAARGHLEIAKQSYDISPKDSRYPHLLDMLGISHLALNAAGRDTTSLFPKPDKLFTEASKIWKDLGDDDGYWTAQGHLGLAYDLMATRGIEPEVNKQRAFDTLEKLSDELEKHSAYHPESELNLAKMYVAKADKVQASESIYWLQQAVRHFVKGTIRNRDRTLQGAHLEEKRSLAIIYDRLIQLGIDEEENRSKCLLVWKDIAAIYLEHKLLAEYVDVQLVLSQLYADRALKGIDVKANMGSAISHLKIALDHSEELLQWDRYFVAKTNMVWSYLELYRRDIDPPTNWMEMKRTLDDGIKIFNRHGLKAKENEFKKLLQRINYDHKVMERDTSLRMRKRP